MRILALMIIFSGTLWSQTITLHSFSEATNSSFESISDLDGDGLRDVIFTNHMGSAEFPSGFVQVYSAVTGEPISPELGAPGTGSSGTNVWLSGYAVGDCDQDGIEDIAMGDFTGSGGVLLFSGRTWEFLGALTGNGGAFSYKLVGISDLNGDGYRDFLISSLWGGSSAQGIVHVVSGESWITAGGGTVSLNDCLLFEVEGVGPISDRFGISIAAINDINDDAIPDFVTIAVDSGEVLLASGLDGEVLQRVFLPLSGTQELLSVRNAGDLDGDEADDLVILIFDQLATSTLVALSGATTQTLWVRPAWNFSWFGLDFDAGCDLTGDGVPDVLATGQNNNSPTRGLVIVNGKNGRIAAEINAGPNDLQIAFGRCRFIGDQDGDGKSEVATQVHGVSGLWGNAAFFDLSRIVRHYPGSGDDLILETGISAPGVFWPLSRHPDIKEIEPGEFLIVQMRSEDLTYVGTHPVLLASPLPSGQVPSANSVFPELFVDPGSAIVLLDHADSQYLASLPAHGALTGWIIPASLSGSRWVLQGLCLAPSLETGNPHFVATDAHELRF